jgi:hypothetical protein
VPSRVAEVDAPSAMISIDATRQGLLGIGPVFDPILEDTCIDLVETPVIDKEGVMLHLDVVDAWFSELEDDTLVQPDRDEWSPGGWFGKAKEVREEGCRDVPISGGNDRVVELIDMSILSQ